MPDCIFVSDLHGQKNQYEKLFRLIRTEIPDIVFIGGDILPSLSILRSPFEGSSVDFINQFLIPEFKKIKDYLDQRYPDIFLIMGNDDPRFEESSILAGAAQKLWHYIHNRHIRYNEYLIFGYSYIPPSPFRLKDWERYDVSRFVDVGSVSPEEGQYTIPISSDEKRWATISKDLETLSSENNLEKAIFVFHSPPYQTNLDRAGLDGKMVDHAPVDVNIGSIAIRKFIEKKQPLVTLHGHVHESSRITGNWRDKIGNTHLFSAAYEGPELAVIRFDPEEPASATRSLI